MKFKRIPGPDIRWYLAGLLGLFAVYLVADYQHFQQRSGFLRFAPYLFLLLLYAWILFHNRVLFDGLYLAGKKRAYFGWTGLALVVSSLNMHTILHYAFRVANTLPQILNLWVYTLLGLGVHVIFRYLREAPKPTLPASETPPAPAAEIASFTFTADGEKVQLACTEVIFVESLENYVKVHTAQKAYLVRLSMKEAEDRLPKPQFLRVSRSHILNARYITASSPDTLHLGSRQFKIGKVYKKYVEDYLLTSTGK